jgi:hypothetical protein
MVTIITMQMATTMAIDQLDVQSGMDSTIATRKVAVDHCVTCTPLNNHQKPSVLANFYGIAKVTHVKLIR